MFIEVMTMKLTLGRPERKYRLESRLINSVLYNYTR